jgi:hypothetical protein
LHVFGGVKLRFLKQAVAKDSLTIPGKGNNSFKCQFNGKEIPFVKLICHWYIYGG